MKSWYQSKILWVNAITTVVAILALVADFSLLTEAAKLYVILGSGILNAILRVWFTETKLV